MKNGELIKIDEHHGCVVSRVRIDSGQAVAKQIQLVSPWTSLKGTSIELASKQRNSPFIVQTSPYNAEDANRGLRCECTSISTPKPSWMFRSGVRQILHGVTVLPAHGPRWSPAVQNESVCRRHFHRVGNPTASRPCGRVRTRRPLSSP
jgi:hypothetical protein